METEAVVLYKGFRLPAEIISEAVWLYHRFLLSFHEVPELLLVHGIIVCHEMIRAWWEKFGLRYAAAVRRLRPKARGTWPLGEVFIKIGGVRQCLRRAVDLAGSVLDILVQSERDAKAAKRFMAKQMKKQHRVPRVLVPDKCRSYGPAQRELMRSVEHRSRKGLNNRAENSPQSTRQCERGLKYVRSLGGAQMFLSAFSAISPHFRPRRHLVATSEYGAEMAIRFAVWDRITGVTALPAMA